MILTEAEAAKCWCPHDHREAGPRTSSCIGSLCMMWAWVDSEDEYRSLKQGEPVPIGWTWCEIRSTFGLGRARVGEQWGYCHRKRPQAERAGECGLIRQAIVEAG
jgi:hypothetical protein